MAWVFAVPMVALLVLLVVGSITGNVKIKSSCCSYGELSQLFQTVEKLGLVLSELPHQRGPLVFEEISALGNEDGSAPSGRAARCGWRQVTA